MEIFTTAYWLMILSPIIPCFLKLSISYRIRYKTPKLNVDKHYKKRKESFWVRYFYTDIKQYLHPFLYFANCLSGWLAIAFGILSFIYFVLLICKHRLTISIIPSVTTYIVIALTAILLIFGVAEIFDDKRKKN